MPRLAAISAIRDEGLLENAAARGQQLREGLSRLVHESDVLKEVRGQGLLLGLEFQPLSDEISAAWKAVDESGLMPSLFQARRSDQQHSGPVRDAGPARRHGIYTQVAARPARLRIEPPLTISTEQVDYFLARLEKVTSEWELGTHVLSTVISKSVIGHHDAAERHRPGQGQMTTRAPQGDAASCGSYPTRCNGRKTIDAFCDSPLYRIFSPGRFLRGGREVHVLFF